MLKPDISTLLLQAVQKQTWKDKVHCIRLKGRGGDKPTLRQIEAERDADLNEAVETAAQQAEALAEHLNGIAKAVVPAAGYQLLFHP